MFGLWREPVKVSREAGHLADVGRLDEPCDPPFESEREAAVRRHAVYEGLVVEAHAAGDSPRTSIAAR